MDVGDGVHFLGRNSRWLARVDQNRAVGRSCGGSTWIFIGCLRAPLGRALVLVDQKGLVDVALHDVVVVLVDVLQVASQEDASPLARCLWLHDEGLLLVLAQIVKLLSKF